MARVFSGIKPTGDVHLGNLLGALVHWVDAQHHAQCVYCVVDLHALTVTHDPAELRDTTLGLSQLLLAVGLDPDGALRVDVGDEVHSVPVGDVVHLRPRFS